MKDQVLNDDTKKVLGCGSARLSQPDPNDVILGRGKSYRKHKGNVLFDDLIDKCRESYFQAQKSQKKVITLDIVEMILSKGGNFLKYDKRCKKWVSISTESARIKAAQALQYRQRRLGEKESDDLQSQASSTSTPTKQGLSTFGDSESLCSSVKDNVLLQKSMTWKTSLQKGVTVLGTVGSTSMEHEYSLETNLDAEVSLLFRDDFLSLENVVTSGFCILLLWKKNPN